MTAPLPTEPSKGTHAVDQEPNKRDRETNTVKDDGDASKPSSPSRQGQSAKKARRCPLHVEATIQPTCPSSLSVIRGEIRNFIESIGQSSLLYTAGPVDTSTAPPILQSGCLEISIVDLENDDDLDGSFASSSQIDVSAPTIAYWHVSHINVHAYVLCEDEAEIEELENADDEDLTACETLTLPNSALHGLWDSLILPRDVKRNLLEYAHSALLFSDLRVSPNIIDWNRVVLLHGPPGTGKTSLCRALAQKLAIRMSDRFPSGGFLLEIHSHSLFSKWFSESGKLVSRLFHRIREMVEDDPDALVCVLVDEVESLAAARAGDGSSGATGEPSDAIRAVNSLLTSIDRLRRYKNVIVMTTTNLTGSVDVAFVDRADIKQFIGLPILEARYEILKSCVEELMRVGIVNKDSSRNESETKGCQGNGDLPGDAKPTETVESLNKCCLLPYRDLCAGANSSACSVLLLQCANLADGLSGRSLRKLPFQSHAMFIRSADPVSMKEFLDALKCGIESEQKAKRTVFS